MKITIALICAVVSVLFSMLPVSWLRSSKGTGEDNARIYAVVKGRVANFRSFQYVPVIAFVLITAVCLGAGCGWKHAAACLAGAAACIIPVVISSEFFAGGVTAAFNDARRGEIQQSVRAGSRTGIIAGCWIQGICLACLALLFLIAKTEGATSMAGSLALGTIVASCVLHTGGEVYSSAYALAVPADDFTDRTGSFIASASDFAGSYILAAASAIVLADIGVATSGVTSTFTAATAARFPVYVYAAGIIGTIVGAFCYRAGIGSDFSRGGAAGCIAAGIVTAGLSFYLSISLMQSRVYAWTVTAGIAAGLVMLLISRFFAPDSRLLMSGYKAGRSLGKYSSVVFNLGTGMITTAISAAVFIVAIAVSYMFASYYGVALCAVGMCSILGSVSAVDALSDVAGSVSDILDVSSSADDSLGRSQSDILYRVYSANRISGRTYGCSASAMSLFAVVAGFFYISGTDSFDIMSLRVFEGLVTGTAAAFILTGMLIGSVRITGRVALRDIGRNDDETGATSALRGTVIPVLIAAVLAAVIGLLAGSKALLGFVVSSSITGSMIVIMINNSGRHFENSSVQALSSLLKLMAVFALAFLPVFTKIGGFILK